MVSRLASGPSYPWLDSQHPQENSKGKNANFAEVKQWLCLEESGQWLQNVDQTHQVELARGKLLQTFF